MNESIDLAGWRGLPDDFQFTVKEVAEIFRVSGNQVRNAIREGRLRAFQLKAKGRGTYRIEKQALEEYLYGCKVPTALPDPEPPPRQNGRRQLKHIKPTWLHGPSPPPEHRSGRSDGRNAR